MILQSQPCHVVASGRACPGEADPLRDNRLDVQPNEVGEPEISG